MALNKKFNKASRNDPLTDELLAGISKLDLPVNFKNAWAKQIEAWDHELDREEARKDRERWSPAVWKKYNDRCEVELLQEQAEMKKQAAIGRKEDPLMDALWNGKIRILKHLIKNGTDLKKYDSVDIDFSPRKPKTFPNSLPFPLKFTPLTAAVRGGNVECVKEVIASGVDINIPDEEGTAVFWAVRTKNIGVLNALIQAGANLGPTDGQFHCGQGPLEEAAFTGNLEALKVLIDAGAMSIVGYSNAVIKAHDSGQKECLLALIAASAKYTKSSLYPPGSGGYVGLP